jgi:chaperonin cofactor prefoldin
MSTTSTDQELPQKMDMLSQQMSILQQQRDQLKEQLDEVTNSYSYFYLVLFKTQNN